MKTMETKKEILKYYIKRAKVCLEYKETVGTKERLHLAKKTENHLNVFSIVQLVDEIVRIERKITQLEND